MTALVMRDLARRLEPVLATRAALYELAGPAGGVWLYGGTGDPVTCITMEALDFHLMASGRLKAAEARGTGRLSISGDDEVADRVLAQTFVVY
jgi:hypothetical protein